MAVKILKYRVLKNGKYRLTLEDGRMVDLYDEIILKHNLLIDKQIDDIDTLVVDSASMDAYYKGIRYLGHRLHTENELKDYLVSKEFEWPVVLNAVGRIKKEGYIDDRLYAKAFVHDQLLVNNHGYSRILGDLKQKGVDEEYAREFLDKVSDDVWKDKIDKIIKKKIKSNKSYGYIVFKDKLYFDLYGMGYSKELIGPFLNKLYTERENIEKDDNNLIKNFDMLERRYSKKYKNSALKAKIITTLMRKGYRYKDIEKVLQKKYM